MKNLLRFNTDCLASLRTYIILDFVLASVVLAVYNLTVSLKSHTSIRYSVLQTFLSKTQIYKLKPHMLFASKNFVFPDFL